MRIKRRYSTIRYVCRIDSYVFSLLCILLEVCACAYARSRSTRRKLKKASMRLCVQQHVLWKSALPYMRAPACRCYNPRDACRNPLLCAQENGIREHVVRFFEVHDSLHLTASSFFLSCVCRRRRRRSLTPNDLRQKRSPTSVGRRRHR